MEIGNEIVDYVIVIPGSWESVNGIEWEFMISKSVTARNISLKNHTTVTQLHSQIASVFVEDESRFSIRTTYCLPKIDNPSGLPYVKIVNDSDLFEFRNKFKQYRGLNMLVSFDLKVSNVKGNDIYCPVENGNEDLQYDTDGMDNSQLLAYVEIVEAANWNKRRRENDTIGVVVGNSKKILRTTLDADSSLQMLEEDQSKMRNQTLLGRGMPSMDTQSEELSTQYNSQFYELASLAEAETIGRSDIECPHLVCNDDLHCMSKGSEEYISLAQGGRGMQTIDTQTEELPTQYSSQFYELVRLGEIDAVGISDTGCLEELCTEETHSTRKNTQDFNSEAEGGRGMPTLDSGREELSTQDSSQFNELASFAENEDVVVAEISGNSYKCSDDVAHNEAPSFDLRIEDLTVDDRYEDFQSGFTSRQPVESSDGNLGHHGRLPSNGNKSFDNISQTDKSYTGRSIDVNFLSGQSNAPGNSHCHDNTSGNESNLRLANSTIYKGRVFDCKKDMYMCVSVYAVENTFCFKVDKSDKERWVAVCIDRKCKWRVRAMCVNQSDKYVVTKFVMEHTCDVTSRARYVEKATAAVIARLMQTKYSDGKRGPRAVDLMDIVFQELKVNISYIKAWNIKETAVCSARGSEEDSYLFLSTYLHLLKISNPGSLSDIVTSADNHGNRQFKYLFMALAASIKGYQYLRKVVVIDGTHLKGKYKGCLVSASGQDANLQIFPLAFAVVDSENEDSWVWFLEKLKMFVPDDSNLVFVSDRHNAIYAALSRVYPDAHHGACTVHLWRNVKSRFKSKGLATAMSKAARAYTIGDFKFWWDEIKKRSPACCTYLTKIGLHHWALSHFKGNRYNIMSSNIAESLNNAMGTAVDFPIVSMLEYLRTMLMRWFSDRKAHSSICHTRCPPRIEAVLLSTFTLSTVCSVRRCSQTVYQVNNKHGHAFTVDIDRKSCTCKAFDILRLPCPHAIAVCVSKKADIYLLVDPLYLKDAWEKAYDVPILPIPRREDYEIPLEINGIQILPPSVRRPPGRPPIQRIPSTGEDLPVKRGRCGRCGLKGHNRTTCTNPI